MKISRENYEIWFADWLDGKLSNRQQEDLNAFLNENPDLKKEFNNLAELILHPSESAFHGREKLIRNSSEIPSDQFELLCAASLEGDLSPEQLSELSEIRNSDPEKKRAADLIALTKLKPLPLTFPLKRNLYKRTSGAIILRIVAPIVGIAAMVALVIMTGIFRKQISIVPGVTGNTAQAPLINPPAVNAPSIPELSTVPARNNTAARRKIAATPASNNLLATITENTSPVFEKPPDIISVKINPVMQTETLVSHLAGGPAYMPPQVDEADDERSRIGKFLARTLREKVLEEKAPSDRPLKGYEIAEAGITGINKLLGWEMALTRNTSNNGQNSSLNFNSRLLKFNTPVKNNEQGE